MVVLLSTTCVFYSCVFSLVRVLLDVTTADAYYRLLGVGDVFVFAVLVLAKLAGENVFGFFRYYSTLALSW